MSDARGIWLLAEDPKNRQHAASISEGSPFNLATAWAGSMREAIAQATL
jgi:hypothetical protein